MNTVLKETKHSAPAGTGRGKRSAIPVPITITAVDKEGQSFREDCRTLVITRHGMMIETIHRLDLGTEITVENPALGRKSTGRVVWCGTERSGTPLKELGIYLTDAEGVCGVELAPEETERRPAARPEGYQPENPPASALPQPSGAASSEQADSSGALPAEPLVRNLPESVKPLTDAPEEAHAQQLDLTSELGQVEAVSRGSKSPTFPALDDLTESRGGLAGPTQETSAFPPIMPAGTRFDAPLPVAQLNSAVEASLTLLEQRIAEIVPVQFAQFEQKLEVLAQRAASLVEAKLQESVVGLEPKIADLVERETASLRDRLQRAHVEVEGLLTRLEEPGEQVHTSLPASVAKQEEEYAAELELRMEATLARHLAAAEDRLQGSRAAVESLLSQIEDLRQKTQGDVQNWAARPAQESSALVDDSVKAEAERHLSSLVETLQNSQAEVQGLLARVEEQRQRAEAGLEESAQRLEGESASQLEQRMTAALEQHLASVADRLKGSVAEVEGVMARLEEQRQRAETDLEKSAQRVEGESTSRLEQRMTAALEQHLASVADRLKGSVAEVEGVLARLEEQRRRAEAGLEESAQRVEGESASRLEQRMTTALDQHLASVVDRLKGSVAEVEGVLARLEEQRQQAEAGLQESASRLEGESAARFEQRITTALERKLASVADRLKSSSAEVEGLLARLEEQEQRAEGDLRESASRLEGESAARLEQRITTALDQQLASITDRLRGPRAEVDGWLGTLEEVRQKAHRSLQEAAATLETDSGARLEQKVTATLEPQLASAAERLQSGQAAVESLLAHVEETGRQIQSSLQGSIVEIEEKAASSLRHHLTVVDERLQSERLQAESLRFQLEQAGQETRSSLEESATRLEQDSAARLEERMRLFLDQQMALALERQQGARVEIEASLNRLQETQQQLHASLEESATRLEQRIAESLGQQTVAARKCLQGARLTAESAVARLEELRHKSHAALQESVATWEEESASRLEKRIAASFEQHLASAEDRLQGGRAELEGLLTKVEESRDSAQQKLQQSAAHLQQEIAAVVETQMASFGSRVQASRAEVESMMAGFEETRREVRQDLQASAAHLEQRVNAFLDQHLVTVENRAAEMRADAEALLIRLEELQRAGETEITKARATLQELGSQTVQFALEGANEKLEAEGERTLAEFRSRSAEIVQSECSALSQRASSASDFIREWSQQAAARLSSYSQTMEATAAASAESRLKQIVDGFGERLQNDAAVVLGEVLERVQQTAGFVESTTVEALQGRVQNDTQELVETTAAHLRQLAQENLDLVSKQLGERQQQFTAEISAALHRTFDELVEASSARVRKMTDDSLELITDQLASRQKLLVDDTTKAFRQKVGEILVMLQNGSAESSSS